MSHLCLLFTVELFDKSKGKNVTYFQIFDTEDDGVVVRTMPIHYVKRNKLQTLDEFKNTIKEYKFESLPKFMNWIQTSVHELQQDNRQSKMRLSVLDKFDRSINRTIQDDPETFKHITAFVSYIDQFFKSGSLKSLYNEFFGNRATGGTSKKLTNCFGL